MNVSACNGYALQILLYINYGRVAAYLWRRQRAVADAGLQTQTRLARYSPNIIKMLVTVALLFLAAWAPYFTIMTFKVRSV